MSVTEYGHYHIEYFNGGSASGALQKLAEDIRRNDHLKIKAAGFICGYACGNLHELTAEDRKALGLNPDLTRRTDIDAVLELCDAAIEVARDCGELGGSAPSDVEAAIDQIKKAIVKLQQKKPPKPKKKKG